MVVWIHRIVIARRTWPHASSRTSQQMYRTNGNTHNLLSLHRLRVFAPRRIVQYAGFGLSPQVGKGTTPYRRHNACTPSGGIAARSRENTPGQRLKRSKASSLFTTSYYQSPRPQPTTFFQTYGRVPAREILSRRGDHVDTRMEEMLRTGLPQVAAFLVSRAYRPF